MNQSNQAQPDMNIIIICEGPNSRLYKLHNNIRTKLFEAPARLCYLESTRTYFLGVDSFCQNLFPTVPLVTIVGQKGLTLIFPNISEGLNGIFIPGEPAQFFGFQLSKIQQLIPFQQAIQIPQFKTSIDLHCSDIIKLPLEDDIGAISVIQQGGEAAKRGFMWLGDKMAKGVNAGGAFIQKNIEKKEEVQVSQDTKVKYAVATSIASQTANATGQYLSQLFKPVVEAGKQIQKDINKKIDESNNQTLKDGRQIAIASWDAGGNALSGLGSALSTVGDSVGSQTKQIVTHKYGEDVTNTFIHQNTPEQKASKEFLAYQAQYVQQQQSYK